MELFIIWYLCFGFIIHIVFVIRDWADGFKRFRGSDLTGVLLGFMGGILMWPLIPFIPEDKS